MTVNLVIKSATQTVDDFEMQCDLTWTIGQIKEKITEQYPTKPMKENQKLIYGGKLLPNHLSLKSILNPTQERHTIHLVCPAPEKIDVPTESKQATPSAPFPVPPSNATFPPLNQPIINTQGLSGMPSVNASPYASGDALQQYLAMQQMYAQFMTQYLSQYNGGAPPVVSYSPFVTVPPVQTPVVPAPQQNVPPNPPRREEQEVHDFLEYVYILCRAVLLFASLCYYSSIGRLLIVVGMFVLLSVYAKLNRQNQQEQQRQAQRQRTEEVREPVSVQAENQETAPTAPSEETSQSEQAEGRSFTSMFSLTVSLISSFFTSLIPADPVPVNVN